MPKFPHYSAINLPAIEREDEVLLLALPDGTERIWVDLYGAPSLRPVGGLGPKSHRPAGYLTGDDRIISDSGGLLGAVTLDYLRRFFTGAMRDVHDLADIPAELRPLAKTFGACSRCENPHGKKHSASCRHAGKYVGDTVTS